MADDAPVVVPEGQVGAGAAEHQFNFYEFIKSTISRLFFFYLMMSAFRTFFGNRSDNSLNNATGSQPARSPSFNLYNNDQLFDFHFYLSPNENVFRDFDNADALVWSEKSLRFGDWKSGPSADGSRVKSLTFPTPSALLQNQSYYLHTYFVKSGQSHVPRHANYAGKQVVYGSFRLNKYKKKFYKLTSNLITGKTEKSEEDQQKATTMKYEVLNYWHPNITVNLVYDHTAWTKGKNLVV